MGCKSFPLRLSLSTRQRLSTNRIGHAYKCAQMTVTSTNLGWKAVAQTTHLSDENIQKYGSCSDRNADPWAVDDQHVRELRQHDPERARKRRKSREDRRHPPLLHGAAARNPAEASLSSSALLVFANGSAAKVTRVHVSDWCIQSSIEVLEKQHHLTGVTASAEHGENFLFANNLWVRASPVRSWSQHASEA